MKFLISLLALLFSTAVFAANLSENIVSVYATFQQKSTHDNITINYLSTKKTDVDPVVFISKTPGAEPESGKIRREQGKRVDLPKIDTHFVYTIEIDSLEANTTYYFVTGDPETGYSHEMSFTTLPNDSSPIVLLQGGDMGPDSAVATVPSTALKNEPHVILIGGDIAYADGKEDKFNRWVQWFSHMNEVMLNEKNQLTPLILAIGNHETNSIFGSGKAKAPYFFGFFQQGGKSYFSRKLGADNLLLVLDTGHTAAPGGKQKRWLEAELESELNTPNKLAMYHIPLYPAHRKFGNFPSTLMRSSWRRVFDKYNLAVAFENHDHVYKRTHMLKDNKVVDSGGTVFVGDGCWGRKIRSIEDRWYIHASVSANHVWTAILEQDRISLQASADKNYIFDEFYIDMKQKKVVETLWYLRGLPRPVQDIINH